MEESEMTVLQIAKLAEWLRENGHTENDVINCINFIAGYQTVHKKELGSLEPTKSKEA